MANNTCYSLMYCTWFDDGGVVQGDYSNYKKLDICVCSNTRCDMYDCIGIIKIINNEIHIISECVKINFERECGGWKFRYYARDLPIKLMKWINMVDTVFSIDNYHLDRSNFIEIEESINTKSIICNNVISCVSQYNYPYLPYELWLYICEMLLTYEEYMYVKYKKEIQH